MQDFFNIILKSTAAIISSAVLFFSGASNDFTHQPPEPASVIVAVASTTQELAVSVVSPETPPALQPASSNGVARTSIIVSQPAAVVTAPITIAGVSQNYVDNQIQILRNSLSSEIFKYSSTQFPNAPGISQYTANLAVSQRIDQLTGTRLSNITVSGVSGLTAADIPSDIVAGNYLPLAGGTLSGALNISGNTTLTNATSTNLFSTTASSTNLFAQIATLGSLTAQALGVNGLSTLAGLFSTASSTIGNGTASGGLTVFGGATTTGNAYVAGNVTIGTTSPISNLLGASHTGVRITNDSSTAAVMTESFRNAINHSKFWGFGARGTAASPSALLANDNMVEFNGSTWDGTAYQTNAQITFKAESDASAGNAPSAILFGTAPAGSGGAREVARITSTGNVGIGTTTPWGLLSVNANGLSSGAPQFVVGSSTRTNFIVDNAGNVGIGTSSPGKSLDVAGNFRISSTTRSHTFDYPTDFSTGELLITNNSNGNNVIALQNTNTANSFSAMAFRGSDNTEHGAVGYGNSTANSPFTSSGYFETSNYVGGSPSGTPPDLKFVQSGTLGGGAGASYIRQQFFGSSGNINLFGKDGVTAGLVQQGTNGVFIGANPTSDAGGMFGIRGDSTSFSTIASPNSSNLRVEQLGNSSAVVVYLPTSLALTYADGAMRIHIDGNSSTAPNLSLRNDGSGTWINYQAADSNNILMSNQQSVGSAFSTGYGVAWSGSATDATAAKDTWISRRAAGVVQIGTSAANVAGTLLASTVGIGTTTPYANLTVWGADTSANTKSFVVANSASTTLFAVSNDGNATLSGTLTQGSDRRLKENIAPLGDSYGLAAMARLNPVSYGRIDQPGSGVQLGFIAQEVQPILPELVSTSSATALTPDGTLTLNYINVIPAIVKAIQELANKISTTAHLVIDTLTARDVQAQRMCLGSTCITEPELIALLADRDIDAPAGGDATTTPDTTSPVITINGANPAHLQIGDTYSDLGAAVTDNIDQNIGVHAFLGTTPFEQAFIDTSVATTYHIDYVATDAAGNAATSTRTVIVGE